MSTIRVMFVCSGNICRSPLAHRLFEKKAAERGMGDRFRVESSGTTAYHIGEEADGRMRKTAARRGLDLRHRSRGFSRGDLEAYDLIVVMGHDHLRDIARMDGHGTFSNKIHLFREFDPAVNGGRVPEVPDPWYGGMEGFEEVYDIVDRACDGMLDRIEAGSLP